MNDTDAAAALQLISQGKLGIEGRLVAASNATFYCTVSLDGLDGTCVYKPVRGERPLRDFPPESLARREVATYRLSVATEWDLVPPTVLRDGPFGPGMCQLWVEHEQGIGMVDIVPRDGVPEGWISVLDAYDGDGDEISLVHADDPALRRMAVLDAVTNNADRKGGHVLVAAADQAVFGVDHGLTFHVDDKLRTVLWGWAGEPLDAEALETLARLERDLCAALGRELGELLDADELAALSGRVTALLRAEEYPLPGGGWPSMPWPVF